VYYGTFSSASDVWSYGVTLWEMFTFREQPYGDKTGAQVMQFLENNGRLAPPKQCPDNVYAIMMKCWAFEASQRPSFSELADLFKFNEDYLNTKDILPMLNQTQC
jgi:tyrosine-protein kinase